MVRIFKQYIPVSFFILGLLELGFLVLAVYVAVALRFVGDPETAIASLGIIYPKAICFALVMFVAMAAMGLFQRRFRHGQAGMMLRLLSSFLLGSIALSIVYYLFPAMFLGRGVMAFSFLFAFIFVWPVRFVFLRTIDQDTLKRRVLVLGAGEQATQITQNLRRRTDQRGFRVVGYVHVKGEHDVVDEEMVIRPEVPLLTLATQLQIDEIVVAVGERRKTNFPVHELLDCKLSGIDVIDLSGFFEREVGKIKLDILNPS